ncbi:hypothetical protein NKJ87_19965 [Mesorhizobium sp. M0027]|uniref:hypothetical protein n=1 Tax=Mesorhizobium sp. M0027 TaxID=2956848 RepID=UPI003334CEB2
MKGKQHLPTAKDRRMVEAMAAVITQAEIAVVMAMDEKTLRKHYRAELDVALIKANASVGNNLLKIARGTGREAVTAAIFWLKTRAGWSEYSPPPKAPKAPEASEKPLGKKQQADIEAREPPADQEWGDLVGNRRPN